MCCFSDPSEPENVYQSKSKNRFASDIENCRKQERVEWREVFPGILFMLPLKNTLKVAVLDQTPVSGSRIKEDKNDILDLVHGLLPRTLTSPAKENEWTLMREEECVPCGLRPSCRAAQAQCSQQPSQTGYPPLQRHVEPHAFFPVHPQVP